MLQLIKYDFNIKIKDLEDKVKKSDFLITDGTHRIVGIKMTKERQDYYPIVSLVCCSYEVAYTKNAAFRFGKKIITDKDISAKLFKITVGNYIPENVTIHHKKLTKNRHYPLFNEIQM